jgi:Immunoglobulin-like domain of bacterial spore germination/Sporulation and spore germination
MNPTDDHQVRALLEGAVADVEPRGGLDSIRSRTARSRGHRGWVWGLGGAAVAAAAAVAAVAVLGGGPATTRTPAGPAARATASSSGPVEAVYFVGRTGAGPRLFPERHRAAFTGTSLVEAVSDAVSGTSTDQDYRTLWPSTTHVQHAQLSEGVLSVDLSGPVDRPAGMSRADAALALQQVVYTAQAAVGKQLPVTFLVNGRRTPTLLGEPTGDPVPAAAADDTLTVVTVASPAEGAEVGSPFTVTGKASAFEANVQWELRRDGGAVVRRGFATAAECCTLSPYSFTVKAPPGDYTLVVHDEDPSDGEGTPATMDTKRVTVR